MKKYILIVFSSVLFFLGCKKEHSIAIDDYVDKNYEFDYKETYLSKCEHDSIVNDYYLKSNKDSIFRVAVSKEQEINTG